MHEGRKALERWRAEKPTNYWDATPNLTRVLRAYGADDLESRLAPFGADVAQVVEPAAQEQERNPPRLAEGERIEFDPARARSGEAVWRHGIFSGPAFAEASFMYLLAHAGEAGHACPMACTAGLVRALREHASPELRDRWLPPLLGTDYATAHRGAQCLTEVQGGSDVGANATRAVPDGDAWRITGEKFFCSVADADQFVVTARPEGAADGTAGLACFLVPRLVDARPNGFTIERLKDKLGTRSLATGEIAFDGALAYPLGALEDGFKIAVGVVLNTSRWLNACGRAGLMRRAYLEASSYARHRTAFGSPIAEFPLVRENLAVMKAEEHAALASTMALTALVDGGDPLLHRFLVNSNKYMTSITATHVVRRGIEVLGGNGAIEDFSPLPRLYRDAIVFESWEGTHNVLVEQVRRDALRFDLVPHVFEWVRSLARGVDLPRVDPQEPMHFRRQLGELHRAVQAACLLWEAEQTNDGEKADVAAFFLARRDPEGHADYARLVDRVVAPDITAAVR